MDDLIHIVDLKNDQITNVMDEVVIPSIVDFENIDKFVELVETGKNVISVMNQPFWGSVINYILLKFDQFSLVQMLEVLNVLDQLGFNELKISPNQLPDHLLIKQTKIIAKF